MGEIGPRDIRFGKTDDSEGNRPTDIIISSVYKLKDLLEICIAVAFPEKNGFVFLSDLYYATSKEFHYFDLKKIKDWENVESIVFKFFYRSGKDNRLRLKDCFLRISLDEDGPRVLEQKK